MGKSKEYNPEDDTITIGGVEVENWESFEFKKGEPDEILEDLDRYLKIIKES